MFAGGSEPGREAQEGGGESGDRLAVILNGNAKNVTDDVVAFLGRILPAQDLYVSRSLTHAREIARSVVERGYRTVLAGGGDGTFSVVVTNVVKVADALNVARPRFGYLKLGTGNALAHVVGADESRGLAGDILRLKTEAGSRPLNLVSVDGQLTPFCGFGVDAVVLQDYQKIKSRLARTPLRAIAAGPLSYVVSTLTRTLPSYLLRRVPHCRVTNLGAPAFRVGRTGRVDTRPIATGEVLYDGPALIAAASTIPYYGYGFRMFPYADEMPDRMNLRISTLGPTEFVKHLSAIWRGEHVDPSNIFDFLVQSVRVTMDPSTAFQVGGDVAGERGEAELSLSDRPVEVVDFYSPPSQAAKSTPPGPGGGSSGVT